MKKPSSRPGDVQAAAVDHQLGAFLHARADVALDALQRVARDDRAHLDAGAEPVADLQRAHALGERRHERSAASPTAPPPQIAMQRSPAEP